MNVSAYALRSPILMLFLSVMLMLGAAISIRYLPVQLLPNMDKPRIVIRTDWGSASPYEVESEILAPQERELRGVPGLDDMNTSARVGRATVNLVFSLDTDMQKAMLDVVGRLNRVSSLPADARPPMVFLGGTGDAGTSLMSLFFQTLPENPRSIDEYQQYFDDVIRPELQRIPGVAELLAVEEGSLQQLQINFDPYKLASLGIGVADVSAAIAGAQDVSGGMIEVGKQQLMLRYQGRFTVEQMADLVVTWQHDRPILLRDFARVQVAQSDPIFANTQNGKPSYFIRLMRQPDVNLLDSIAAVKAKVAELNEQSLHKQHLHLQYSFDPSVFIDSGIRTVTSGLWLGVLFTMLLLWWLLGNLRTTLIIVLTIPLSFSFAFIGMALFDISINLITLAGFTFASGIIVDAATIAVESMQQKLERNTPRLDAIIEGCSKVAMPIIASTLTAVVAFIPMTGMNDAIGQIFEELAFVLTITVSASAIVAITVVPLVARYFLPNKVNDDRYAVKWQRASACVVAWTQRRRDRWLVLLLAGVAPIALSVNLLPKLDYLPAVNRLMINAMAPVSNSNNIQTLRTEVVDEINRRIKPYHEGDATPRIQYFYASAVSGFVFVGLHPYTQEDVPAVIELMKTKILADLPGINFLPPSQEQLFAFAASDVFAVGRYVNMQLQGADENELRRLARLAMAEIDKAAPGTVVFPQPALDYSQPEIQVKPNVLEMGQLGVSHSALSNTIRAYGDGLYLGEYMVNNKRVDAVFRTEPWQGKEGLENMPLVTNSLSIVPIKQVADIHYRLAPSEIQRNNGVRTITLTITPPESLSLEEMMTLLKTQVAPALDATDGVSIQYTGQASDLGKAFQSLQVNFAISLFILFMILAAMFRSVRDSVLILLVVPSAIAGGIFAFYAVQLGFGQRLDLITVLGFIVMLGLVANNAILLLAEYRMLQADSLSMDAALKQSLELRMRPLFITAVTSLSGLLPMMLMQGETAVIYRGLAAVIFGGTLFSMLYAMLILPVLLRSQTLQIRWRERIGFLPQQLRV